MTSKYKKLGFERANSVPKPKLMINITGQQGSGKNHFAFTAPDPILVQSLDLGSDSMVEKFAERGKEIWLKEYDPPRIEETTMHYKDVSEKEIEEVVEECADCVSDWKSDCFKLMDQDDPPRTLVWDTASDFYRFLRFARTTRIEKAPPLWYTKLKMEYNALIARVKRCENMNFITLHRMKDKWVNDKNTGKKEFDGQKDIILYHTQVDITARIVKGDGGDAEFMYYFNKCRPNVDLNQTLQPAMCFAELVEYLFPDADLDEWGVEVWEDEA
jgi:hypothetical protein